MGSLPKTQFRFAALAFVCRRHFCREKGQSMRYKNKPAHAANNKGYSGEYNQLLQYFHDLLLISLFCLAAGIRHNINCRINWLQRP
jgi:hypothetical protein